jgi:hypothetical protein
MSNDIVIGGESEAKNSTPATRDVGGRNGGAGGAGLHAPSRPRPPHAARNVTALTQS